MHASLGNISEHPHAGILVIDFERDLIGLHVNGRARIVDDEVMRTPHPELPEEPFGGRRSARWTAVEVEEAYIHCRKNIPRMAWVHEGPGWETDDPAREDGDYFGAKAERPARAPDDAEGSVARPETADSELTAPIPAQHSADGSRFPSTTHLLTGSATARPLREAARPARSGRRIRWLSP